MPLIRPILLLLALLAAGRAAAIPPQSWSWSLYDLQVAAAKPDLRLEAGWLAQQLALCEKGEDCTESQYSALLALYLAVDKPGAQKLARRLAQADAAPVVRLAREVLAIGGEPTLLLQKSPEPSDLDVEWALARGGVQRPVDALQQRLLQQDYCYVLDLIDPFLQPRAAGREQRMALLLQGLGRDAYAQARCAAAALERNWALLDDSQRVQIKQHLQALLTADLEWRRSLGLRLARVWLPRLDADTGLAAAIVEQAAIENASASLWREADAAARDLALLADSVPSIDPQARAEAIVIESGHAGLSLTAYLLTAPFSATWRRHADSLGEFELIELLAAMRKDSAAVTALADKRSYLQTLPHFQRSFAAGVIGLSLLPAGQSRTLARQLNERASPLQQTALSARWPSLLPAARSAAAWREALVDAQAWIRFAALANAAHLCASGLPPGLAGGDALTAYTRQLRASLQQCEAFSAIEKR